MKQKIGHHKNWISGIKSSGLDSNHIATSSYDGSIKVWDIRSTLALYTLRPNGELENKMFAIDWVGKILASGGEDAKLHVFMP